VVVLHFAFALWDFEKDSKERETEVQGEGLGGDGVNE
jgi:hypothetical protein